MARLDLDEYASRHAYPTCFTCGPHRAEGDGLRVFPGPTAWPGVVAWQWIPHESVSDGTGTVDERVVWAALDCPGAIAVGFPKRGETVLGRLAAHVDRVPRRGERCVVVAWPLGEDGRKLFAGTAVYGGDGRVLGAARATWIVPR